LHFGSLLAAVASYAQTRVNNGRWLLRIEDIDPPREQPGADKLILDTLEALGFEWAGSALYQSDTASRHQELVADLLEKGLAYPCSCSRRDLAAVPRGPLGTIYPGTCRNGCVSDDAAVRLRVDDTPIGFEDALQGYYEQRLETESGDFVIKRRDGLIAYHLAVVADDFDQGITEIVRGIDLLDSTPRQIYLQRKLGFCTPSYMHIPVAVNIEGQKLSKMNNSPAIQNDAAAKAVCLALRCLNQDPPDELAGDDVRSIWAWVAAHWDASALRAKSTIPAAEHGYGLS
jgi:glutamyl-Q tRNA(Asp) synthetase